jgi:hypothetical protein
MEFTVEIGGQFTVKYIMEAPNAEEAEKRALELLHGHKEIDFEQTDVEVY